MEKSWTEQEIKLLQKIYSDRNITNEELVSKFGRTLGSIQTKAIRLGLGRKKWTAKEDLLLKEKYQNPNVHHEELAKLLNRSIIAIHARAHRLGILDPINNWSILEDNILRENYLRSKTTPKDLLMLLPDRTWNSIVLRASHLKLGSRRGNGLVRTYSFNFDFFEEIDTPEKAYWLGFAFADGSLRKNSLRFGLIVEGEKQLKKLISAVQYSGQARFTKNGIYELDLTHPKFAKDLREKGVIERKTWSVSYPKFLIDQLHRHFIRGVFDGDGTITTGTTHYRNKVYTTPSMSICGAVPEFLQAIVNILSAEVGVKMVKVIRRKWKGNATNTWAFSYSGTPALRIRDFLYGEAGTSMDCKRKKFYEFNYSSKRPQDKEHQNIILQKLVEKKNGLLLSKYFGYDEPITVQCEKGHVWTTLVSVLKGGSWCPKCRDQKSGLQNLERGKNNLNKWLQKKRWQLLSEYKGNEEKVLLKCEHGKIFSMQAKSVKCDHAICDCNRNNSLAYGKTKLENILHAKGWKLVSDYSGFFNYVTLTCKHERLFKRLPGNIRLTSKCDCERKASSGFKGVYQLPSGKWQARIRKNGQEINLGTFETIDQAVNAREMAELRN
jgi:hypothetical protein